MAPLSPFSPLRSCYKNNFRSLHTDQIRFYCFSRFLYLFNVLDLQSTYVPLVNTTHYCFSHFKCYTCEPIETKHRLFFFFFLKKVIFWIKLCSTNLIPASVFNKHIQIIFNVSYFHFNIQKLFSLGSFSEYML